MSEEYVSSYRGCTIIVRCSEAPLPSDFAELAALPSSWSKRFTVSYSVTPPDASEAWQQFPKDQFCTRDHAGRNALSVARLAIDTWLGPGAESVARKTDLAAGNSL
jgi:hypothetical protein